MSEAGNVIKVSRPKRYDPVLAQQAQELHHARRQQAEGERSVPRGGVKSARISSRESLKHDLGLSDIESDSCDSSVEEHVNAVEEPRVSPVIRKEDYELLQQRYMTSLADVHKLGQRERKAVESMHKLKQICHSQSLVMRQSFRRKLEKSEDLIQRLLCALHGVDTSELGDKVDELVASCQQHTEELDTLKRAESSFESKQVDGCASTSAAQLQEKIKSLEAENTILRKCISDLASGEIPMLQPGEVGDGEMREPGVPLKEKYAKAIRIVKATKARIKQVTAEKNELVQLLSEAKHTLDQAKRPNQTPHVASLPSIPSPALPPAVPETADSSAIPHQAEVDQERQLREKAQSQVLALSEQLECLRQRFKEQNSQQASAQTKKMVSYITKIRTGLSAEVEACKSDLAALGEVTQRDLDELNMCVAQVKGSIVDRIKRLNTANKEIERRFEIEYKERRRLLNELQALRGNVRVLCRVRPALAHEADSEVVVKYPREDCVQLRNSKGREKRWEFTKVLSPELTNADIFANVGDLCISVLDGYNVCIFAYGQTGSGKTHTMEGTPEDRGVNFLALEKLFQDVADLHDSQIWNIEIRVSFLEIYNEQIRDLLTENGAGTQRKLEVKNGENGMYVPNLAVIPVDTHDEVLQLMRLGQQNRSVASTDMNTHSSRSHSMLSVYVTCRNYVTKEVTRGKLHLIDLAGSERLAKSGAVGMRKTEAACINKSLSALGDVIHARANKKAHVPYRNSVLTYLLQDSLSRDSKTLMFVQISPVCSNAEESFCSLNFASRVQKVELGKASRHVAKES